MPEEQVDQPEPEARPDGGWVLVLLALYLLVLGFATVGELFEVDWILDLFSFKG